MSKESTKEVKGAVENKEKQEIILINEEVLRNKIYVVRGQKVMLDVDLAEIYGYETKNFNRQVKNNKEKFEGDDFMFQLTKEELDGLSRCKNCTLNRGDGQGKNIKYSPYAFTEQGIYMLMTVLRGDLATKQSRARRTIYIVDNYIGIKTLEKLINIPKGVTVSIFSDNLAKLNENTYLDFCKEYPNISINLFKAGGIFHDRYIILDYDTADEKVFLCGGSSKDAGGKITSILEDQDRKKYEGMIKDLLKNPELILNKRS